VQVSSFYYFIERVQIGGKTQKLREPVGGKLRKTLTENARTNSRGIRVSVGGLVTFPPTAAPKKKPTTENPTLFFNSKKINGLAFLPKCRAALMSRLSRKAL
jgi:hypothetical protein